MANKRKVKIPHSSARTTRPRLEAKAKRHHPAPKKPAPTPKQTAPKQTAPRPVEAPTIPFGPEDRILLIGEGDLSFAASLVQHHGCMNVTATVLEKDAAELAAKYPDNHAAAVLDPSAAADPSSPESSNRVMYGIDATRPLPTAVARPAPDRILFNFPHVGGMSTDVNRQVRHNQQLLVTFFQRAAIPTLAPGGSIVVTLFEGEPYTLWNIRDLARHAGLQVERSFRFQPDAYPGYKHARTLGVVKNRKGEAGGGWKGEERASRSYVFVKKGEASQPVSKKRGGGDESSGEE